MQNRKAIGSVTQKSEFERKIFRFETINIGVDTVGKPRRDLHLPATLFDDALGILARTFKHARIAQDSVRIDQLRSESLRQTTSGNARKIVELKKPISGYQVAEGDDCIPV